MRRGIAAKMQRKNVFIAVNGQLDAIGDQQSPYPSVLRGSSVERRI